MSAGCGAEEAERRNGKQDVASRVVVLVDVDNLGVMNTSLGSKRLSSPREADNELMFTEVHSSTRDRVAGRLAHTVRNLLALCERGKGS